MKKWHSVVLRGLAGVVILPWMILYAFAYLCILLISIGEYAWTGNWNFNP